MTTPSNPGAETSLSSASLREIAEREAGYALFNDHAGSVLPADDDADSDAQQDHHPEAKALLQRYLSDVHSFREKGNHALRNLEARLASMPFEIASDDSSDNREGRGARGSHGSHLIRPSLAATQRPLAWQAQPRQQQDLTLQQRLQELSTYLHADLSKEHAESTAAPEPVPGQPPPGPDPAPAAAAPHKIPTLPVLDRAWFEERFALMRTTVDRLAEQLPLNRLDALEAQFQQLMERLTVRESARDPRPLDASLKELAAYLADSRQWAAANEKRVKGLEDRLDRLSNLVAQSHAAISATAKGLELVAKGTGEGLALQTADIVIARIGQKIDEQDPTVRLDQLGREVAHLTAQSRHLARSAEEQLGQLHTAIKDQAKPAPHGPAPAKPAVERPQAVSAPNAPAAEASTHDQLETYLNHPIDPDDDYDSEMIAAAQHAAALADGPARSAAFRNGPVRYQIPYGEFLPDENGPPSRAGLIVAVVILAMAGATMMFLKWKEWTLIELKPAVMLEGSLKSVASTGKQARLPLPHVEAAASAQGGESAAPFPGNGGSVAIVTGSTPAAPPLVAKQTQLWVSSKAPDQGQPVAETPQPNAAVVAETLDASIREAAIKGDANAQFSVGQSYLSGNDRDGNLAAVDPATGLRWFRRAAERGNVPAQYKLATLYELGHGTPRDFAEAETWYERAASRGHVRAMHNLAVLSTSQNGKSSNYLTAARWFTEAAAYGLVDSQFNLGILCERGWGVARNMAGAYRWFAIAARQGDAKAMRKRDDAALLLTPAERQEADRLVAEWAPKQPLAEINRLAQEPPAGNGGEGEKPAAARVARQPANAAVVSASWKTDVAVATKPAPGSPLVMEAQRLLRQKGYDPGPADGVAGQRTRNAIRSFQRSAGLPETGEASKALLVKLAFLPL